MALTQRHVIILGGIAAFFLTFWYVDMPSTIRLKTSILKLLPMKPATLNQSIRSVCAGSYVGLDVASCYSNFQSEEAEAAVASEEKCARFKKSISTNTDWFKLTPKPGDEDQRITYTYQGSDQSMWDKYGIMTFYPDDCYFISLNKGEVKQLSFN
jgi:hypothetical protein